uniref:4-(cytidine 5'-diphospho)-2-C-methyl-D-erythritol kinase n=1 Tax=Phaeomonas parva TaxID=124430 RepID=A0A7S1XYC6_9STRA|eukprot:CAMPEP_0118873280 /NCGR_PEP_ID=MMETSP1163-20130328/15138_1 /TAXON_ID=124430 /ORGANISM="Phaeomonas parva, Strain CCMP2877" /LENGTH=348 /DNA_ID=CAMNT_0006808539 /DNA_START=26 /DNA_END=1072 /DNA_ORIENTATION=+
MARTAALLLAALSMAEGLSPAGLGRRVQRQPWRLAATVSSAAAAADLTTAGDSLTLSCPAKLNLFLRVVRRREDGFHDLASLFQTLKLGDKLELAPLEAGAAADVLHCDTPGVPTDASNLVIKALDLFRERAGVDTKFAAVLEKATPAEAGLGGGSSDAAAAMFGANKLCGYPATEAQLLEWSGEIGSDISFFFSGGTAYCTGRGEIVEPVEPLPSPPDAVWLVKPPVGLSTPRVFKALDLDARSTAAPEELLAEFVAGGARAGRLVNDLEQPAFDCIPELGALKEQLGSDFGFDRVMMSGSGTTLFALGNPADEAAFVSFCESKDYFHCKTEFTQREADSKDWYPTE